MRPCLTSRRVIVDLPCASSVVNLSSRSSLDKAAFAFDSPACDSASNVSVIDKELRNQRKTMSKKNFMLGHKVKHSREGP